MNSIARVYSVVLGAVLLLIGLLGWLPVLTPGDKLLGVFAVNTLHNLAHVLTGSIGVGAGLALSDRSVRAYTIMMSSIYGLLALVGAVQIGALEQALALNLADTILHAGIFAFSLFVCAVSFTEFNSLQRLQRLTSLRARGRMGAPAAALRSAGDPYAELVSQRRWANPASLPGAPGSPSSPDRRFASPAEADSPGTLQERVMWLEREVHALRGAFERQDALEQQQQQLRRELEIMRAQLGGGQGARPTGAPEQFGGARSGGSPAPRSPFPFSGSSDPGMWQTPPNPSTPPAGRFAPPPGFSTPTPYTPYTTYGRPSGPSRPHSPSGPSVPLRPQASLYPQYPSLEPEGQATQLPRYGPGGSEAAEAQRASDPPGALQQGVPHQPGEQDQEAGVPSSWRTQPW